METSTMTRNTPRLLLAALGMLFVLGPALPLRGDDAQEMLRLDKEWKRLTAAGRYREAEQMARQALAIAERSFANYPPLAAVCLAELGNSLDSQGRYVE